MEQPVDTEDMDLMGSIFGAPVARYFRDRAIPVFIRPVESIDHERPVYEDAEYGVPAAAGPLHPGPIMRWRICPPTASTRGPRPADIAEMQRMRRSVDLCTALLVSALAAARGAK